MFKKLTLMALLFGSFGLQATRQRIYRISMHTHCAGYNRRLAPKRVVVKVYLQQNRIKLKHKRPAHVIIHRMRVSAGERRLMQRINASNPVLWKKITIDHRLVHLIDRSRWTYQGECCCGVTFVPSNNYVRRNPSYSTRSALNVVQLWQDVELNRILDGYMGVKLTLRTFSSIPRAYEQALRQAVARRDAALFCVSR